MRDFNRFTDPRAPFHSDRTAILKALALVLGTYAAAIAIGLLIGGGCGR